MAIKIWHKIVAAPGVAIALLVVLGAVSYGVMARQHASLDDMYNRRFGNYRFAADSAQAISEVHSNVYRLFTWIGTLKQDRITQITNEQKARVDDVIRKVGQFGAAAGTGPEERKHAQAIVLLLQKYRRDFAGAIDISTVDVNTGMVTMQAADTDFQAVLKDLHALVDIEQKLAQESYDSARAAFEKVVLALLAIVALSLLVSGALTFAMSRIIVRPLRHAISAAGRIARGDLASEIRVAGRDETARIAAGAGRHEEGPALAGRRGGRRGAHGRGHQRADRAGQPRPVAAHRGAGQHAGGDRQLDGGADRHGHAERGERARRPASWRSDASEVAAQGRRGGGTGGQHHGRHLGVLRARSPTSSA